MNGGMRNRGFKLLVLVCSFLFYCICPEVSGEPVDIEEPIKTQEQMELEEKFQEEKARQSREKITKISPDQIDELTFPEDDTLKMSVKRIRIEGNKVMSDEEILSHIPLVYNASTKPMKKADSEDLYDLRTICEIIDNPGQPREVSARTIRGLTQCILKIYNSQGYSGIFVSVPSDALVGEKLKDDVLIISVIEARISSIQSTYYNPENEQVEKGYLKDSFLRKWTPVDVGEVGKQKELSDYVNLLNQNPDRYVATTVSKGEEPNTLAVSYKVYEANPWHWFIQMDNYGTKDRRYTPRLGFVNTNLMGFDDQLIVYYQAPWEKGLEDRYSLYGSYDFPIMGPKLRLMLFGAYNQFEVEGGGGIDFLGNGSQVGAELRYNVCQKDNWFFDVVSSLSHEKSRVSSTLFDAVLGSEVWMNLWGVGVDLHKRTDMANTSVTYDHVMAVNASSQQSFNDARSGGADDEFSIDTVSFYHSQYLDEKKIQRLLGSVRWIVPNARMVPAKATIFGGMYSVRGYRESGIVADGGILASIQYEYDLVKHGAVEGIKEASKNEVYELRKLAPLVFFDYGKAEIEDYQAGIDSFEDQELYSVGFGGIVELGDNFVGNVYYGQPLKATTTTDTEDGRFNFSVMLRW